MNSQRQSLSPHHEHLTYNLLGKSKCHSFLSLHQKGSPPPARQPGLPRMEPQASFRLNFLSCAWKFKWKTRLRVGTITTIDCCSSSHALCETSNNPQLWFPVVPKENFPTPCKRPALTVRIGTKSTSGATLRFWFSVSYRETFYEWFWTTIMKQAHQQSPIWDAYIEMEVNGMIPTSTWLTFFQCKSPRIQKSSNQVWVMLSYHG